MEWAEEYGDNLSSLWDILWGMPHKGNDFIILRPKVYTDIPYGHNESFTNYVDKICRVFLRAQEQQFLTVEIRYTGTAEDSPSL